MSEAAGAGPESVPPRPGESARVRGRAAFLLILAAAGAWRVLDCRLHPWSPDQLFSVRLAQLPWGEMLAETTADVHPPLYYALLKLWFLAAPNTLEGAQWMSVAFSLATLAAIRALARDLFGEGAGWVALLSAAFAPYAVFWSHTARNHAILPLFAAGTSLFGWRYLRDRRRGDWWLCAACLALAFQTNYMGVVFGAVWCVAMVFERGHPLIERLRLCGAGAPGAILFSPWVSIMFEHTTRREFNPGFFQEQVSPIYLYYHAIFGGMVAYQPPQSGVAFVVFLGVFAIVCGLGLRVLRERPTLGFLLLAVPLVPILMARFGSMTLAERHLLFALPLFYVYWGGAVAGLLRRPGEGAT